MIDGLAHAESYDVGLKRHGEGEITVRIMVFEAIEELTSQESK